MVAFVAEEATVAIEVIEVAEVVAAAVNVELDAEVKMLIINIITMVKIPFIKTEDFMEASIKVEAK
jgi:hypothetical protein